MSFVARPLSLFGVAAAVSVGGALFGADRVGGAFASFALVLLAAYVARASAGPGAARMLTADWVPRVEWVVGAGLLLLGGAAASRNWHPVTAVPAPAGAGRLTRSWVVASPAGPRLTGVLLLLAGTALAVAVYQLPGRRRPGWPVLAAAGLAAVPLIVATSSVADEIALVWWPRPSNPWPLLVVVLPGLVAAALAAVAAAVAAGRARDRLVLTAGALAFEVTVVADVLRAAHLWSLATLVSTPPDNGRAFLSVGLRVQVDDPSVADRLLHPQPGAALLAALTVVGPALLALGATRPPAGRP